MGNASSSTSSDDGRKPTATKPSLGPKIGFDGAVAKQLHKHAKNLHQRVTKHVSTTPRHLKNVFARPIRGAWDAFHPQTFPKGPAEADFLRGALGDHFVFQNMDSKVIDKLVLAFEEYTVPEGTNLISQGDSATGKDDYFFILKLGAVDFIVDDEVVGSASHIGDAFGELALLYSAPRAATVHTTEETTVYRLHQQTFRNVLHLERKQTMENKMSLLQNAAPMFRHLRRADLKKLQALMVPRTFTKDQVLCKRGDPANGMAIIRKGEIKAYNIQIGGADYADMVLGPGQAGGQDGLFQADQRRTADAVALTDGLLFYISKEDLESVFPDNLAKLVEARKEGKDWSRRLAAIPVLRHAVDHGHFDEEALERLGDLMVIQKYCAGDAICREGKLADPAMYFVSEGTVEISTVPSAEHKTKDDDGYAVIHKDGFFGQEQFLADAIAYKRFVRESDPAKRPPIILDEYPTVKPVYTATATSTEGCTCHVLYLRDCRRVIDTTKVGARIILSGRSCQYVMEATGDEEEIEMGHRLGLKDLKRHRILGAGTFGQVWLTSYQGQAYALKIQSKYQLCDAGQAEAVVREKNIMASLHHPFLANLVDSFQDDKFVYMLMGLIRAGELHSVIHRSDTDLHGLPENDALFFAAGIHEGLAFLHSRGYVHRDLKPENVLINDRGYPVIIDFGFVKYVTDKTYTFCGTPLYMAPEVILNMGHDAGADHWSYGVMIYELLVGQVPFIHDTQDQRTLFREICQKRIAYPEDVMSVEALAFLQRLLVKSPVSRLGWRGENDIYYHPWLAQMDFQKLFRREYKSPCQPDVGDPFDASRFHEWKQTDMTCTEQPPLTNREKEFFEDF